MTASDVIGRLEGVRVAGAGWLARCPAHDDRHASLSVGVGEDGRVLLHCHAGCDTERVLGAITLTLGDLYPPREKAEPITFDYCDENGALLFQVCRFPGKEFRQRRPDGRGGWIWKLGDSRRVLYRLPELREAAMHRPVFLVEGEKDVEALRQRGLVATSNVGGAGKWREEWSAMLADRDVVIIPDNDGPGRQHAARAQRSLAKHARRVRVIELPGLPDKGDVSDWFAAGNTAENLVELLDAEPGSAERERFVQAPSRLTNEREERLKIGAGITPFGVTYLDDVCRGILPRDLIVVGARTGAGKTALASMIATEAAQRGVRVHFFALEAEPNEIERRALYRELVRRLYSLQAPGHERMNYLDWYIGRLDDVAAPYEPDAIDGVRRQLATLSTYYRIAERFSNQELHRVLDEIRNETDLVILDHLHYVDEDEGEENRSLKNTIKVLRDAALNSGKPVIVVAHLRKKERGKPQLVPDLDDFHGTSDIVKFATRVITLAPARDQTVKRSYLAPTYVHCGKDRPGAATPLVALMYFDMRQNKYLDGYRIGRLSPGHDKWDELAAVDAPRWARRATNRQETL